MTYESVVSPGPPSIKLTAKTENIVENGVKHHQTNTII